MSSTAQLPDTDAALQTTLEENAPYVGLMTRVISWAVDFLLINLVAIITGLSGGGINVGLAKPAECSRSRVGPARQ